MLKTASATGVTGFFMMYFQFLYYGKMTVFGSLLFSIF